jgi:hypothetical protein
MSCPLADTSFGFGIENTEEGVHFASGFSCPAKAPKWYADDTQNLQSSATPAQHSWCTALLYCQQVTGP